MEQTPETQAQGATTAASRTLVQLTSARAGVLGIKAGMTQVFTEDGDSVAVTVIDLKPTVITQVKTKESNGYKGIQVGILEKKAKSVNKPDAGHAKKSGSVGFYHHQEFRLVESDKMDDLLVGKVLSADFIKPGDLVDLTAVSKGKGFQGGMKRFHMAGGHKTHGASVCHRSLGSIGQRADPGRVWKNRKMPGQMGNVQRTVQNVRVIRVDVENQLLLVHGSVPGGRSGIVTVQRSIKAVSKASKR
jgi:large subunit ribosomal protein L3